MLRRTVSEMNLPHDDVWRRMDRCRSGYQVVAKKGAFSRLNPLGRFVGGFCRMRSPSSNSSSRRAHPVLLCFVDHSKPNVLSDVLPSWRVRQTGKATISFTTIQHRFQFLMHSSWIWTAGAARARQAADRAGLLADVYLQGKRSGIRRFELTIR